jgi:hypothetical protein
MLKFKHFAIASLVAVMAVGCSEDDQEVITPNANVNPSVSNVGNLAVNSVDAAREDVARKLAKALTNVQLREFIKEEVLKKFDGDYDVLFSKVLTQANQLGVDLADLTTTTDEQPLLNLAVPVNAESWNAQTYTPLVAFLPGDYDEATTTQIKAFDASGNVHILDTKKAPSVPVIVIGQNERTEIQQGQVVLKKGLISVGTVKKGDSQGKYSPLSNAGIAGCGLMPYDKMLYLTGFRSENLGAIEHWTLGAPEIRMNMYYADQNRNVNLIYGSTAGNLWEPSKRSDVDKNWWRFSNKLTRWSQSYGDMVNFNLWEEDGGSNKGVPVVIKGKYLGIEFEVNFTVTIKNDDEYIGAFPVDRDFCTNWEAGPFGNESLKFIIDYADY